MLTPKADEAAIPDASRLNNQSTFGSICFLTIALSSRLYLDHSRPEQARHRASASQRGIGALSTYNFGSTKVDAAEAVGETAGFAFRFLDVVDMLYIRDICVDVPSIVMAWDSNGQQSITCLIQPSLSYQPPGALVQRRTAM